MHVQLAEIARPFLMQPLSHANKANVLWNNAERAILLTQPGAGVHLRDPAHHTYRPLFLIGPLFFHFRIGDTPCRDKCDRFPLSDTNIASSPHTVRDPIVSFVLTRSLFQSPGCASFLHLFPPASPLCVYVFLPFLVTQCWHSLVRYCGRPLRGLVLRG